jgi:hypothetical protein
VPIPVTAELALDVARAIVYLVIGVFIAARHRMLVEAAVAGKPLFGGLGSKEIQRRGGRIFAHVVLALLAIGSGEPVCWSLLGPLLGGWAVGCWLPCSRSEPPARSVLLG